MSREGCGPCAAAGNPGQLCTAVWPIMGPSCPCPLVTLAWAPFLPFIHPRIGPGPACPLCVVLAGAPPAAAPQSVYCRHLVQSCLGRQGMRRTKHAWFAVGWTHNVTGAVHRPTACCCCSVLWRADAGTCSDPNPASEHVGVELNSDHSGCSEPRLASSSQLLVAASPGGGIWQQ